MRVEPRCRDQRDHRDMPQEWVRRMERGFMGLSRVRLLVCQLFSILSLLCTCSLGGAAHMPVSSLPPEFMQAVAHQITQQAMAAAASAAAGNCPSAAEAGEAKGQSS